MGYLIKIRSFLKNELKLDRRDWLFMGGFVFLLCALSLILITKFNLWYDEAFSAYIIRFDFFEIAKLSIFDVRSPLYYWALKLWSLFFGDSEFALRSLSVLFGALTIISAYILVKYISGRSTAILASTLLLFSPMFIRYSNEVRMYTMMSFFVILSTLLLIIAEKKQNNRTYWRLYGIAVGTSILVQYMSVLVFAAHWLWRFLCIREYKSEKRFFSTGLVSSIYCSFVVILPWLPFMIGQYTVIQDNGFWVNKFNFSNVTDFFSQTMQFISLRNGGVAASIVAAIVLFVLMYAARLLIFKKDRNDKYFLLFFLMVICPVALLTILSLPPFKPVFVIRYLICSSFFLMMLIAILVNRLNFGFLVKLLSIFAVLFYLILGLCNLYKNGEADSYDYRSTAAKTIIKDIDQRRKSIPIIVNNCTAYFEIAYYAREISDVYFVTNPICNNNGNGVLVSNNPLKINNAETVSVKFKEFWYIVPLFLGDAVLDNSPRPKMEWIPQETIIKKGNGEGYGFQATLFRVADI